MTKELIAVAAVLALGCASAPRRECSNIGPVVTHQSNDGYGGIWLITSAIVGGVEYSEPEMLLCDDGTVRWHALPKAKVKP